jgi:hypothetical protein
LKAAPALARAFVGAAAMATAGCIGPVFREVEPTFASLAMPVTEILPVAGQATLVMAYPSGPLDGGRQAITYVLADGSPVGQVVPHSFAVARIPAGRQTVINGVPELGAPTLGCGALTYDFKPGKVYVVSAMAFGGLVPVSPDLAKTLSKVSHFAIDVAEGQRRVAAVRESFWIPCIKAARQSEASAEALRKLQLHTLANDPQARGVASKPAADAEMGADRIDIPPPP